MLRIEAPDSDRAGSGFAVTDKMRRQSRAILSVLFGCVSVCLSAVRAQPITSAYVNVNAWVGHGSQSNATLADLWAEGDYSNLANIWWSRGHAQTSFGLNGAYASAEYVYATGVPLPSTPTATASYVLSWSTLDHSSSGSILSLSLSSSNSGSITGLQLGSFQFQYGTPYIIQSSLNVYASYNALGSAVAKSVWSDTFTFQGQPHGTLGVASFDVNLNGSISTIFTNGPPISYWPGPSGNYVLTADFSNGASLDYVFLPDGASLTTSAGFPAIVTTPEPSAAALLLLAGCGFCLRRSRYHRIRALK